MYLKRLPANELKIDRGFVRDLDQAMPDAAMVDEERARLAGPDRDAMRSVVAALCEELVRFVIRESIALRKLFRSCLSPRAS